jgi:LuxR family maltose regulon positive regulatory protein
MHVGLSEVFLELNDLEASARELEASREHGDAAGLPQNAYRWRVATALLLDAQGDGQGALELLADAERFYNTDFSPPVRPIPALKARIALRHGDIDTARRWPSAVGITTEDDLAYVREFEHITLVRMLLAQSAARRDRRADDAMGLLQRLLTAAERYGSASVIELQILLARVHHAHGDAPQTAAALEQALTLAHDEGYLRVFIDEGPAMVSLLHNVSLRDAAAAHAQRVLAACQTQPERPRRSGLVDELSSRELDVLRLLRSELSGPDIARELLVSLNTLRTHTKNIYAKLGVNNRREAIRRAAELGLVAPPRTRQYPSISPK